MVTNPNAQAIIDLCEQNWDANKSDCSAFVKSVAAALNVNLTGLANDIVAQIQSDPWIQLANGIAAKANADQGFFVIGGLAGGDHVPPSEHGHVVVVVSGPLAQGLYPSAYWGTLGGVGQKDQTVNFAWNAASRNKVIYSMLPA